MKNHNFNLWIFLIILLLKGANFASAQSIRININPYTSFCAGTKIEIPVTMNGIWSTSTFVAKFRSTYPDTTIYVNAENTTSPLRFSLPKIYRDGSYYCELTIISSLPEVYSLNIPVVLKTLATIKLGDPIQYYDYSTGDPSSIYPKNEYINANEYRRFLVNISGMVDDSDGFILNDSTKFYRSSYYSGYYLSTQTNKTYTIARAWNACGAAKIIPHEFTLKVNPFPCKITDAYPQIMCNSRELNVMFDYKGTYNSDNRFNLEISNLTGDTVRTVPTTTTDVKALRTVLDNSFLPGFYFVRVRSSSPEGTSPYKLFRINPKPVIDMNWYVGNSPTVEYKQEVTCRLTLKNILKEYSAEYADIRLSNGLLTRYSGVYSDFTIYPETSAYYTIDSLIAPCGVIKDFDVIGNRYITVNNGFSFTGQKKVYCVNEKVKLKINSPINFNPDNHFVAKVYQGSTLKGTFPAIIENDSLVFTLSANDGFDPNFGDAQIRVESSSPNLLSSPSNGFFQIDKVPQIKVTNNYITLNSPGNINLNFEYKSQSPVEIVINDGLKDTTFIFVDASKNWYVSNTIYFFVKTNTFFQVKSMTNSCGIGNVTPPYDNLSVSVSNPQIPKVSFKNTEVYSKAMCKGIPTPIYFNYSGSFNPNNEFIIYLNDGYNQKVEVGRGTTSPIMVTIPLNANTRYSPFIYIESSSPITNTNMYLGSKPIVIQTKNIPINFGNSMIQIPNYISSWQTNDKVIEIMKGTNLIQGINGFSEDYIDLKTKYKVNNQWFPSDFKLSPTKDTTLYLQGYENSCGFTESLDTVSFIVKKYRLSYMLFGNKNRCMNGTIDIVVNIEGDNDEIFNNFDFKFIPNINQGVAYSANIVSFIKGVYRLKIPDMPYEGSYKLKITPVGNEADFVQNFFGEELYISKNPVLKLTAEDGSDIIWTYYYPSNNSKIKLETLNSNNPSYSLRLTNDDTHTIQNKIELKNISNYYFNPIEISNISATCGYGEFSGKLYLKKCENSLDLSYYNYVITDYISNGYIQAGGINYYWINYFVITYNKKVLFSAKTKIELLPGFQVAQGAVFNAEIEGCPNRN